MFSHESAKASVINAVPFGMSWLTRNETKTNMTQLEKTRLEDFKRILTYRLVTKIKHSFKGNFDLYYEAPSIWGRWRRRESDYDSRIYRLIILFNQTALSAHQVQSIFGKTPDGKWMRYGEILAQDKSLKVFSKGTLRMRGERIDLCQRYQIPYDTIKGIFEDRNLLEKVLDAESDFYTKRQRRLIFTQINNKTKVRHHVTKKRQEEIRRQQMTDEERINELFKEEL